MIKKFKNGNLTLSIKEDIKSGYYDNNNIENFYHDEMFMNDLTIEALDNDYYIIDSNKLIAYELNYNVYSNVANCFLDELIEKERIRLFPVKPKKYNDYIINLYLSKE